MDKDGGSGDGEKMKRFEESLGDVIKKKCIGRVTPVDEVEGGINENSHI